MSKKKIKGHTLFDEAMKVTVGVSNTTMGARVGKDAHTIASWRTGKTEPKVSQAYVVCDELDMAFDKVWGDRKNG